MLKLQDTAPVAPPIIETPRLTLRALQHDDLPGYVALLNDWEISRWLSRVPFPYTLQAAENWLKLTHSKWRRQNEMALVAVRQDSQEIVGGISLFLEEGEIGYWVGQKFWRQGYATEMLAAIIDYAFQHTALTAVHSCIMPGHDASLKVQQKAGLLNIGMQPYDFNPARCSETEALCHGITRQQWLTR